VTRVGAVVTERRELWLLAAVPTGVLGLLVAGLLSRPLGHPASDYPRVVALLAGIALLGTCVVVALEDPRRRSVLAARLSRWRMVLAALWLVAELVLVVASAGEAGGGSLSSVRASTVLSYVQALTNGRVSVLVCGCVLVALVLVAVTRGAGAGWSTAPVAALTMVALIARPLTGHSADVGALAQVAIIAHVAAASVWCGGLAVVAVVAGTARGVWARMLPRFSRLAGWCAAVVAVSGVPNTLLQLGGVGTLLSSGYGRLVLGKVAALVVLLSLGAFARRRWVPEAVQHRTPAAVSLRRAATEVAVMGLALGLATALATTG